MSKKVLCFTTSYLRPKMLRSCILDVLNQTYPHIFHTINVAFDVNMKLRVEGHMECSRYRYLYDDIAPSDKVSIVYNPNGHQQDNYTNALKAVYFFNDYDIFVKIDDDDIYKSGYVANIVEMFSNEDVDIVSTKIKHQLNGYEVVENLMENLGGNPAGSNFMMPMTFAFNRKALDLILNVPPEKKLFEDEMWRNIWVENGLTHKIINNDNEVIWHLHGKNISTSNLLLYGV